MLRVSPNRIFSLMARPQGKTHQTAHLFASQPNHPLSPCLRPGHPPSDPWDAGLSHSQGCGLAVGAHRHSLCSLAPLFLVRGRPSKSLRRDAGTQRQALHACCALTCARDACTSITTTHPPYPPTHSRHKESKQEPCGRSETR